MSMADGVDSARAGCSIRENKCNSKSELNLQGRNNIVYNAWIVCDIFLNHKVPCDFNIPRIHFIQYFSRLCCTVEDII